MNEPPMSLINDQWIISCRGRKNVVDQEKPYGWLVEKERTATGKIEDVAIIFLTNRECPFHCLMCDLWKNTTDIPVDPGAIPGQIEWALTQLPSVKHLKLYNSGSFFDPGAIPFIDYQRIADMVRHLETLIVESHPKLVNDHCLKFRDMLEPELQVAMGLETVHPEILLMLNKRMTLDDFAKAAGFLKQNEILSRAFILLKPPFLSETEGIYWAERSIDFAFDSGTECCTVIPVRPGNGAMEVLLDQGNFTLPDIHSLEKVLEYGIRLKAGRVFADVWDLGIFSSCDNCIRERTQRLTEMNLQQRILSKVNCTCH
jgi:radical SAM enzyme (TIGR01210 family)